MMHGYLVVCTKIQLLVVETVDRVWICFLILLVLLTGRGRERVRRICYQKILPPVTVMRLERMKHMQQHQPHYQQGSIDDGNIEYGDCCTNLLQIPSSTFWIVVEGITWTSRGKIWGLHKHQFSRYYRFISFAFWEATPYLINIREGPAMIIVLGGPAQNEVLQDLKHNSFLVHNHKLGDLIQGTGSIYSFIHTQLK